VLHEKDRNAEGSARCLSVEICTHVDRRREEKQLERSQRLCGKYAPAYDLAPKRVAAG